MSADRTANPEARGEVMRRVRLALGRTGTKAQEPPAPPEIDQSLVRLASPGPGTIDLFLERAAAVGMNVHRCRASSLPAMITEVLRAEGVRSLCIGMEPGPAKETVLAGAREAGATVVDPGPGLQSHFEVDAGVTDIDAAIAESGSIIVRSDAAHNRGTFIVPPVHIAIVPADRILPDLLDYWAPTVEGSEGGRATTMPTSLVLVTGPSKTADIEGILITGVHGPRVVHVIVVDQG